MIYPSQHSTKKTCVNNSKKILDKNQSIKVNTQLNSTGNLATPFHKPAEVEFLYVCFGHGQQKICYENKEQLSVLLNYNPSNKNNYVNIK